MNQEIKLRIDDIKAGRVPQGYKKTPCGVLPVEWSVLTLSDICKKSTQKNKENEKLTVYSNTARYGLVNQSDFFDKDIANSENLNGYYVVNQNDFVYNPRISSTAPCGPISISNFKNSGLVSPLYTVFNLYNKKYFLDYLQFYFESSKWYAHMNSVANYGARSDRMNVTDEDFFLMPLPSAPLAEQEKIAEILGTWDRAIEKQAKLITMLERRKKSLMQKLFEPKDDWEKRKISDIGKVVTGNTPSTNNESFFGGKFMWVTPTDIVGKNQYCSERTLTEDGIRETRLLPKGTVLITCIASIGKNCIIRNDGASNQQINAVIVHEEFFNEFVYYIITYKTIILRKLACKSATEIISKSLFESVTLYFPELEEQHRIAGILTSADNEIEKHIKILAQMQIQKKSLMQLLLSGIVRVNGN